MTADPLALSSISLARVPGHLLVSSRRFEVFVTSFPSGNGKWPISTEGGGQPMWGRDGRELFYRDGDKIMTVGIEAKSSFTSMKPKLLFARSQSGRNQPGLTGYDVAPDGKRFLMLKDSEAEGAPVQLNVVVNWSEELSRQAGGAVKK
jgi:eukaryotic-like serine/threonine-protein kinase